MLLDNLQIRVSYLELVKNWYQQYLGLYNEDVLVRILGPTPSVRLVAKKT